MIFHKLNIEDELKKTYTRILSISSQSTVETMKKVFNQIEKSGEQHGNCNPIKTHFFTKTNYHEKITKTTTTTTPTTTNYEKYNFIISNRQLNNSGLDIIDILLYILTYLTSKGIFIIKLHDIDNDICKDFIFILSYLFYNVYIFKLDISENNEVFLVCNKFITPRSRIQIYKKLYTMLLLLRNELYNNHDSNSCTKTLIRLFTSENKNNMSMKNNNHSISSFFTNKINCIVKLLFHIELERLDKLLNLISSDKIDEKIKTIRKNKTEQIHQLYRQYKII